MRAFFLFLLVIVLPAPVVAQDWNDSAVMRLVQRGIERRQRADADTTLRSYRSRAHGFVFFLAQVGEGLTEPPRLVKADELDVEVYWEAPNRSKQVILGWRDGRWLPTDINYHRDHLGIVTNNFGDRIRIGEGDEVRDVIHPLSRVGPGVYDYALQDSIRIRSGSSAIRVYEISVRPRHFDQALVVGTLYLTVENADLVRFRFSFTPDAYLDRQLEDITIVLENSLWDGRWWLPYRQEVEIRRRATWLDFPARGIIRGRWEIRDYDFNVAFPAGAFREPAIAGLRQPRNADTAWTVPLEEAVAGEATPVNRQDMEDVRVEIERIAGAHALGGLASSRLATGSVSDLVHVNRVQGLALGAGATLQRPGSRLRFRPRLEYGTSDHRLLGGAAVEIEAGATRFGLAWRREVRDFSDIPVIAPVLNSLSAQEFGKDYGDYVRRETAEASLRHRLSGRTALTVSVGREDDDSLTVQATPATGTYRPNPGFGVAARTVARLGLERGGGGFATAGDLKGRLAAEGGTGRDGDYARVTVDGEARLPLAGGSLRPRLYAGWGSERLPPSRQFAIGGRGTLVGEAFRAWGGRTVVLARLEWQREIPFPAIPLGPFASTGGTLTLAPFVAVGWADRSGTRLPWRASPGVRPVAGVAVEWFLRLIRVEAGVGLRTGDVGVTIDIHPDWWDLL